MKPIADLFGKKYTKPVKKRRSERGDLILYFTERINAGRVSDGYKPVPTSYIGYKLTGISVKDLYFLRSICDQEVKRGTPFGKIFWYSVQEKTKNAHRANFNRNQV